MNRRKVGVGILLLISGLVALNGVGWFFVGPSLSTFEQDTGIDLAEFRQVYPGAAHLLSLQARNTAILLTGIGLLAAAGTLAASREGSSRASIAGWVFALTLAGVGLSELVSGAAFGLAYLVLGVLALLGQLLAAKW